MSIRFVLFYTLVVAAGLGLLAAGFGELRGVSWELLALWIALILAVDAAPVRMPGGGFITVSSTLDYAGILILGPAPVALAEFLATLTLQLGVQRRPWPKALFNASTFAGTVMVAGAVYRVLSAATASLPFIPGLVIPILGMGVVYYALNSWVVSLVIALSEHRNAWHIWQVNYVWTIFHMIASLPFAAAIAVGHSQLGVPGILLFSLPLVLARYSFKLYIDTKQDLMDFATVLAGVIDEIDPYTHRHSQRVGAYAGRIARELGLAEREVEAVEFGGLLHDIGKIKPAHRDLLFKAEHLTSEERARMCHHAPTGADILDRVRCFKKVAPIVRHHHERFDGRGYPDRLGGRTIPLGARIVLVADAFDAMTTDRVYRPALTVERSVEELRRCAGPQFDPVVVGALERLLARGDIRVPGDNPEPLPGARPGLVNAGLVEG